MEPLQEEMVVKKRVKKWSVDVIVVTVIILLAIGLFYKPKQEQKEVPKRSEPVATVMSPTPTMPSLGVVKTTPSKKTRVVSGTLKFDHKYE